MDKKDYVKQETSKQQARNHTCHAKDCEIQVHPAYFMCFSHWKMVPADLQKQIWLHYQPGQEKGQVRPSKEYLQIAREAINYVYGLEKCQ